MHLSITSDVFVQVYLKQGARIVLADILSKIVLLSKQKRWRLWCLAETLHNCQLGSAAVQPTFTILSQKMSPQCHKSAQEYWIVLISVQSPSNKPSIAIIHGSWNLQIKSKMTNCSCQILRLSASVQSGGEESTTSTNADISVFRQLLQLTLRLFL